MSGAKIIEGLKQAIAGNFVRVTIGDQTWVRAERSAAERCALIADNERAYLRRIKAKRMRRGDHEGAKRASIGMTVAARIANSIRTNSRHK